MAASTRTYRTAQPANFNKYLAGKIRSARDLAAEERKFNEDSDVETKPGYFFGKALAREFGGDRIARTRGTFSTDVSDSDDPALTKKERFQNLVRGEMSSAGVTVQPPITGLEDVGDTVVTQDKELKSWLTPLLETIARNNQKISQGIQNLGNIQDDSSSQQEETNKGIFQLSSLLDTLKDYFKKDTELEKKEIEMIQTELDFTAAAADDAKQAKAEAQLEKTIDTSSSNQLGKDSDKNDDGDGGLLSGLFDGLKNLLDEGPDIDINRNRRKKSDTPGDKNKNDRSRNRQRTNTPGPGMDTPGAKPRGRLGRILSFGKSLGGAALGGLTGGGLRKFSEGIGRPSLSPGLYDRPTTGNLPADKGVVPLNRNNPFSDLFDSVNKKNKESKESKGLEGKPEGNKAELLQKAMTSPLIFGGGLLISTVKYVSDKLKGGLFGFMAPIINNLFRPIAKVFGLPENIIGEATEASPAQQAAENAQGNGSPFGKTSLGQKDLKKMGGKKGGGILGKLGRFASKLFGGLFGSPANAAGLRPPSTTPPNAPTIPATQYNITGGNKITRNMFGSRGFGTKDGLGSGATAFGHTGRDVPLAEGTPISLVAPGVVVEASDGYNGGYGNFVVVKLDDGTYIKSNHHSRNLVKVGDRVGMQPDGSVKAIAEIGSTGLSTGPHLHLDLGTGYDKGSAAITGLSNPDNFILGGGIVTGGNVKASVAGAPRQAPVPQYLQNLKNAGFDIQPMLQPTAQQPTGGPSDPNAGAAALIQILANGGKTTPPPKQNEYLAGGSYSGMLQNPVNRYLYTGRVW